MIREMLKQRRDVILKKWEEAALGQFSSARLKRPGNRDDRFGNPAVYNITNGIGIILDELIADTHTAKLEEALEDIVKIKSLQAERPSTAVDFLLSLKKIIKEEWENYSRDADQTNGPGKLINDIDELMLCAFDIFMKCREKIYDIKSKEIMMRSYRLLERANMISPSGRREGEDDL